MTLGRHSAYWMQVFSFLIYLSNFLTMIFNTNILESQQSFSQQYLFQTSSRVSIPFKFYFSNLVSYSISACVSLHTSPEGFSVVNTSNQMNLNNEIVEICIAEEEDGRFVILNSPNLTVCVKWVICDDWNG